MSAWILIFWVIGGSVPISVEFNSEVACTRAIADIKAASDRQLVRGVCVKK